MAADSSVWSSSQGSEIRLPGGGEAELGVEQQQQQLKGGSGGAEIHGSSSPFEEWYDASLIDEMKELSSYPAQQQRHHHQIRNSVSSPAFAAADRRGFSSTFLGVDESGFLGDFAAATAGGLLPPPPPPLLPPPPPRHRFGGGDIGLLDFGAGGGGAAAWAGPNFGIGTSLSIGTMSGTGFSSKTTQQQQHTGSGHSSPSTIIKSPTSAFASADSSLEIGGGGDVEVAAVAATTGRRRRKGGGGGGGSSSSPPAAGEEAGLDGREDEDMDDASGLLCETDDIPAPTTGQPGGGPGGGGKGNRKGLPAKNLMAERRRRKKLNDRLYMLRSVVPRITKMDRASILGDAIEYLKDLLQRINELHNELESPGDGPLGPSDQHIPPLPGMMPAPPPLLMPPTCVKEEGGAAGPPPPPPPPPPSASEPPKVDVRTRDGKTINIHMFCARRPGLLLSTMRALDGLGLDVQQAVISCFNGFVLDVFRAEQCREGEVAPEDIKSALLHTAGCNNEAMPS